MAAVRPLPGLPWPLPPDLRRAAALMEAALEEAAAPRAISAGETAGVAVGVAVGVAGVVVVVSAGVVTM